MDIIVFLGPSLPLAQARRILEADYRPPVSQGELYRAAQQGPRAIGVVDGVFHHVPAVWHKEILWALSRGIRVLGSSSMGALRAAEMDRYGMEGVGEVYRLYRSGALEDDDEVALLHAPAEFGYRPLSEPMVNLRASLAGRPDEIARLKALPYPERTLPEGVARVDVKAEDARALLRRLAELREQGWPAIKPIEFEETIFWREGLA